MKEREEELKSLIQQLQWRLSKAQAGGSDHEADRIRKDLEKFESELERTEGFCKIQN